MDTIGFSKAFVDDAITYAHKRIPIHIHVGPVLFYSFAV